MKFRFPYQQLWKFRKLQEDLAQKDFLEAQKKVQDEEDGLKELYRSQDQARETGKNVQNKGGSIAAELQLIHEYIVCESTRIEKQRDVVRGLNQILEDKEHFLVEKSREKKVIEKLEEKLRETFMKEKDKKEVSQASEMYLNRWKKEDA